MKAGEDVEVILHPVDAVKVAFTILQNAPDVTKKRLATIRLQDRFPAFR
jgi:hypothetical protein